MEEVRSQYEKWIYPQPVDDLEAWVASGGKPAMVTGTHVPPLTLPPPLAAMFQQIDGSRTVGECLQAAPLDIAPEILHRHGLRFFRSLWRTGHVTFRLKETK